MEPNSQNDNLDDLFRRSFGPSENGSAGEGWNSPPTEMWENIRAVIAPVPVPFLQSSRPWKWASLIAALLLVWLSVQLFSYRSTIEELTEQVDTHELRMEALHAELQTQLESNRLSTQAVSGKIDAGQGEIPTVPTPVNEPEMAHATPSVVRKPASYEPVKGAFGVDLLPDAPVDGQSGTSIRVSETIASGRALLPIENGDKMDLVASEVRVPTRTDKLIAISPTTSTRDKENGFYLGLTGAPIWITQMRNGPGAPNNSPKIQSRNGWSAGVKIGKEIGNNWSLESGIQLSAYYTNSIQEHKINFSRNDETSNQTGGYESNYRVNLAAGSEEIDTEVTFTRPESVQPEEGEWIGLDFQITEITNYLDVPIVGRYEFQSGRLNLGFRMGVLNRLKLSHSFALNNVNIGNEKFQPSKARHHDHPGRRRRVSTDLKTYSLHAIAGLGATYQLSDTWQVSLEPTVVRSITPIGTSGPRGKINLEQESFNLNASLEYRF